MERSKDVVDCAPKVIEKKNETIDSLCPICGKPATQSVDGEPCCTAHIEQVYEHQVEDYMRRHLVDNEWRKV